MKRIFATLLLLAMLAAIPALAEGADDLSAYVLAAEPPLYVDLDGDVDAADLTALARHVAKISMISNAGALANADVTKDGSIDAQDLTRLARFVSKIIDTL